MPLSCNVWITAKPCLPDNLSTYNTDTLQRVLNVLQLVSSLVHTSSIMAYSVYCVTNCTGSRFLSECSTSWQLRFIGAFKIRRQNTWSTTVFQSPMSTASDTSLLLRGFDEARSAVGPSLLGVRWLGTHYRTISVIHRSAVV